MHNQGPWILNRGDSWVMPAGTSFGSEDVRVFGEAHGYGTPFSSEGVDAYLRSFRALPFSEYAAYADAALASLAALRIVAEMLQTELASGDPNRVQHWGTLGEIEAIKSYDAWKEAHPE